MTVEDYVELDDKRMLSNPLIEFILELMTSDNENIMYLDSYIVRAIFAAKDGDLLKSVDFTKKICLLPLHQGSFVKGHWTLAIINLEKKTFAFYDSGTAVRNRGNVEKFFFEKFGSFLAICGSKVLGTIKN